MHGGAIASFLALSSQGREDKRSEVLAHRRPVPIQPASRAEAQPALQAASAPTVTFAIVAASFVGLIATFAMHLVNLRMQSLGIAASLISFSVAVQAVAICVTALAAKQLIARVGLRFTLPASSVACSVALVATFFASDLYPIVVLRAVFAVGLTFLVITSEYLVTARCDESNRGSVVAWYTTALGFGTIVGPLLVSTLGISESASFLLGATMLLFGSVMLRACLSDHEGATTRHTAPFAAVRFMPAVFLAAFVFGMADNGGLSLLPVYGATNGYDTSSAANLAVFAALGATLLQFPIGWLAAKYDTTRVLVGIVICSLGALALLPVFLADKYLAYLIAAVLGALFEGLYTVALVRISRERRVRSLSALNACFISVCSLGEVAGPIASGVSMQFWGPHGLVVALVVVFAAYGLAMMNRRVSKDAHPNTFN